jgi:hypothetical protein
MENKKQKRNIDQLVVGRSLNHLKDDASYLQCSKCGRKTYSGMVNSNCNMLQPSGKKCDGTFIVNKN